MNILTCFLLIIFLGCSCLPYKSDMGLMGSAQANSPELMIRINGKICQSYDEIGHCSMKIIKGTNLKITLTPMPYKYNLDIDCTNVINADQSYEVLENSPMAVTIGHSSFDNESVFNCTITAKDIFAAVRFYVVSDKYDPLSKIYKSNDQLVLGESAYITIENESKFYKRKTITKDIQQTIIVESESGKRAYYGFNPTGN